MTNKKDNNSGFFTLVTIAVISLIGTLGAALIGNLDKILPRNVQIGPSPVLPSVISSSPSILSTAPSASLPPSPLPQSKSSLQFPQTWQGTANQKSYGSYPMIMYIESSSGVKFSGKLNWPKLRNSITSMDGKFVENFGDVLERSKWKYVNGFDVDKSGVWLTFTEQELLQGGGILLGAVYYAQLKEDGIIQGVWFNSDKASEPGGDFKINSQKW